MIRLVVDNGPALTISPRRKSLLVQVHVARKLLGLAEDDYRAILERITGHASAKACDDHQLNDAIAEFERLGFRRTRSYKRRDLGDTGVIRKARAMWISLYQLGAIAEGSDVALEAFAKRQLRVDRVQWSSESDGFRLIEALKAMATRHGWDQRVPPRLPAADRVRWLEDRLVSSQLARLAQAGCPVTGKLAGDRSTWSQKMLRSAAVQLSTRIHALPRLNGDGASIEEAKL